MEDRFEVWGVKAGALVNEVTFNDIFEGKEISPSIFSV